MQAIMETLFDIVYLTLVITVGIRMMIKGRDKVYIATKLPQHINIREKLKEADLRHCVNKMF